MEKFFSTLGGKKIAFIGAGVSHRELIPMFAKAGAQVTLCDEKTLSALGEYGDGLLEAGVCLSLGESYLDGLAGQDMILRTPGFSFGNPLLQDAARAGAHVTSEIELFFEHCPCRTVGVTGSDGKTTTTSLIAAMYEADGRKVHLGGNIGRALLPVVDDIKPDDVAVVELSSFQLISMRRSPDIAIVTNITPNHLDIHANMAEYVDAKRNILAWQNEDGVAVLSYENPVARSMQDDVMGKCRFFSRLRRVANGAFLAEDGMLTLAERGVPSPVLYHDEVRLRGEHNIENILAAFAALRGEVGIKAMQQVAREFEGVEHRLEFVRKLDGVEWYNDSIATSPSRVVAGLRAFGQKLIIIGGGQDKNLPFEPLAEEAAERVKAAVLTGPAAPKMEAALRANRAFEESGMVVRRAQDMADAVNKARALAAPGDVVMLSPGCASFDAYANFEERGRHFKELVNALKEQ